MSIKLSIAAFPAEIATSANPLQLPEGRALRCLLEANSSGRYLPSYPSAGNVTCFNPRPPFRAGATFFFMAFASFALCVSILARPFERALLSIGLRIGMAKLFQSSPALSSGRYCTTSPRPENTEFGPAFREPTADCSKLREDRIADSIQVIEK